MTISKAFLASVLASVVVAQQPGDQKAEQHPALNIESCTKAAGCTTESASVTIDQNWRWIHEKGTSTNCYKGNSWDTSICPDPVTCAENCVVGSAAEEYRSTYGVHTDRYQMKLHFVTQGPYSKNVGSRNFLMEDETHYKKFKLKNREFAFDVDDSKLPCGLNGALYFVNMDADGGLSKQPGNKAGAKYGVGYCDAQCPHDLKFINGEANTKDWNTTGPDTGTGHYGSCCTEMDIWEANSMATAYTAHACAADGQTRCEGTACGDNGSGDRLKGICDKNGCDVQTYRLGDKTFFGKGAGFAVDTSQPVTVVTQFITDDGTDTGNLKEIRRHYKQHGKIIETPMLDVGGKKHNSITTDFCQDAVDLFKDGTNFLEKGGLKNMGDALDDGMVLVLSLWDDHDVNMLWLDSTYPKDGTQPGDARGPCAANSGVPADLEKNSPDASVTFANIRYGEIGSTDATPAPAPPPPPEHCCSWDGKTCGDTTDYCAASQAHCEGDCKGQWIHPGAGPSPTPSGCPGGSLSACIGLCPSDAKAFKACVAVCQSKCAKGEVVQVV